MTTKIEVIILEAVEELIELTAVFAVVFEMENFKLPDRKHLQNLLNSDTFIAVAAKVNNKIVGGLTVYILQQYYSPKSLAYLYDLAVLTEHQRKGVGRALISFTNNYCKQRGCEELFVQADKVDDYAIDFYRSTTPSREEEVVQFSYDL